MDRREFLKKSAFSAVGTVAGASMLSSFLGVTSCSEAKAQKKKIGLQLYSLRDAMSKDVPGTMKLVSDMGYTTLETAGYGDGKLYGYTPSDFRKMAEDLGMKVTSAHLGQHYDPEKEKEIMEWWNVALDTQAAAGCKYAIMPSMPLGETLDSINVYCDYFNKITELAKTKGLNFGFHNHAGEFKEIEGKVIFDHMIENTSPDMAYELDVYWVGKGGKNPVDYINKYTKRIPVLHIKDEDIVGDSGTVDFESIFNAAYKGGALDQFYVEVERYTLPAENCVQKSYDFLEVSPFVK